MKKAVSPGGSVRPAAGKARGRLPLTSGIFLEARDARRCIVTMGRYQEYLEGRIDDALTDEFVDGALVEKSGKLWPRDPARRRSVERARRHWREAEDLIKLLAVMAPNSLASKREKANP